MARPTKHDLFFGVADLQATMSTCPSGQVGAVLVRNGEIVSTGYNGSPRGMEHCTDAGCVVIPAKFDQIWNPETMDDVRSALVSGEYSRHVHAELNAILACARGTQSALGSECYVTTPPCLNCAKALIQAGITAVHLRERSYEWATKVGLFLREGGVDTVIHQDPRGIAMGTWEKLAS